MADTLSYLTGAGFLVLGCLAVADWVRFRGRERGLLAVGLGLMAVVALQIVPPVFGFQIPSIPIWFVYLALLASGYALIEFRATLIPMTRRGRGFAIFAVVLAGAIALLSGSDGADSADAPASLLGFVVPMGVFCGCIVESSYRFWRASAQRPAVQRARLRSLSLGYGSLVAGIVVIVISAGVLRTNTPIFDLILSSLAVASIPLLYAGFRPPRWLRTVWRSAEEGAFSEATRDLLLFSPDVATLSQRSLEWALRLVGADAGYIIDGASAPLSAFMMPAERVMEVEHLLPFAAGRDAAPGAVVVDLGDGAHAIAVPLHLEEGPGRLVALSGRFTPLFGADELSRLVTYSTAVTAAIDRTRLTKDIQELNTQLDQRVRERTAQLSISNDELARVDAERRALLQRVVEAQEDERERIARDLHDDAVQVMTAVNMRLSTLRSRLADDSERAAAEQLESTVSLSIERLRHLVFELSPPELERSGLAAALRRRLEDSAGVAGFRFEIRNGLHHEPDSDTRTILYRIAQEALVNAEKHSNARQVVIELLESLNGLTVRVIDDGSGFDTGDGAGRGDRPGHLGLVSMRERAEMAGGWCRIQSAPGRGTTVEFWVPVANPAQPNLTLVAAHG
ncbi:MAG: sensor histidine kinase [Candidatus Dormibacteria bacterium]